MGDVGNMFEDQRQKVKDNDPKCTNPDFSFFEFNDYTAEALGDALMKNTQPLELSMSIGDDFTEEGAKAMAEGLRLSRIVKLKFVCEKIVDADAKKIILQGLEPMKYLNELVLDLKRGLDDSDAELLRWSLKDKRLELFSFRLSPNITEQGKKALIEICQNSNKFFVRPASQGNETMSSYQDEQNDLHKFKAQAKEDSKLQSFEIEVRDDNTSDN